MIGPGARIGEDCVIHAHASVRERVVVGNRVILQNGAVVGSDGYGFARQNDGTHLKIPWFETTYDVRAKPRNVASLTGTKDLQMVNITCRVPSRPRVARLSPREHDHAGKRQD